MNESDFSEHRIPPKGWRFYQAETKWRAPTPISSTLSQTVQLVRAMRLKNPAITARFKLATHPEAIKSEVIKYNRKINGLPEEGTPLPFLTPRSTSRNVGAGAVAANWARRTATGVATLADWLGEGAVPVKSELAEHRASICAECPKNLPGDLLSFFTKPVSELIRKQLEERKQLSLSTTHDEKLSVCDACGCPLRLLVHVPIEVKLKKMNKKIKEALDERCWVLSEEKELLGAR